MITFFMLLPGLLALFMAFLYKRQSDQRMEELEQRNNYLDGMLEDLVSNFSIQTQAQKDLHGEVIAKLETEIQSHSVELERHQRFIENLIAASERNAQGEQISGSQRDSDQNLGQENAKQRALLKKIENGEPSEVLAREFGIPVGEVELMKNLKKFVH